MAELSELVRGISGVPAGYLSLLRTQKENQKKLLNPDNCNECSYNHKEQHYAKRTLSSKPDNCGIQKAELASRSPKLIQQRPSEHFSLQILSTGLHPHQHTFPLTTSQTDRHCAARQCVILVFQGI